MLNPKLSEVARKAFYDAMKGRVNFSERAGINWMHSDDFGRALDAAVEAALREVQEVI